MWKYTIFNIYYKISLVKVDRQKSEVRSERIFDSFGNGKIAILDVKCHRFLIIKDY